MAQRSTSTQVQVAKSSHLQLATDAFLASTSYLDSNYRKNWDDALRMFQNRHLSGSKYFTDTYKWRSKLHRPKTRSAIRRNEAFAASAFFSNPDVIDISPVNESNKDQRANAEIMNFLMNWRLTQDIPWFMTCIGAYQDALTMGSVCSKQYWKFQRNQKGKIIIDAPCIELKPLENIRIDQGANWVDPINTSPFVIDVMPMYVHEVRAMMTNIDDKTGQPKWKSYTPEEIRSATELTFDQTRQTRNQKREDPQDRRDFNSFEIVWVHENIINMQGEDMVFYTLGTELELTKPEPISNVYFTGDRPFVMGQAIIETHKIMPAGLPELGKDLQKEANDIANTRLDNIKLAINKRYLVKRGKNVDLRSLLRNASGSITMVDDPQGDIEVLETQDVTSSSYAEQDRINSDYDDLIGVFSPGSVNTNRNLNETVGGLNLLKSDSGTMSGYTLRTFIETWAEPVLKQLVELEKEYETDEKILGIATQSLELFNKYNIEEINDDLLRQDTKVIVNVGITTADPTFKLQQFIAATKAFVEIVQAGTGIDLEETAKEIYGAIGYRDGKRFFGGQDIPPEVAALQQKVQELQGAIDSDQAKIQTKGEIDLQSQESEQTSKERIALAGNESKEEVAEIAADARLQVQELVSETQKILEGIKQDGEATKAIDEEINGLDSEGGETKAGGNTQHDVNITVGEPKEPEKPVDKKIDIEFDKDGNPTGATIKALPNKTEK